MNFRNFFTTRASHGIELTPAGRAFLDHARLVLSHAEAAASMLGLAANPPCRNMMVEIFSERPLAARR
jgi:DNA-binding transcriptional LysR family regulator